MTTRRPLHPMPEFVKAALEEAGLMGAYRERPAYQQNDYVGWIGQGVREDTRRKRLAQMLDELRAGDAYMKMAYRPGSTPRREGATGTTPRSQGSRGAPPANVDAYLARVADDGQRSALQDLRRMVREVVPDGVEAISYGMPTFKHKGRPLVGFSAAKEHLSFHTMSPDVKAALGEDLAGFSTTKEAVHFTPDRPLPRALVERAVRARIAENEGR